MLRDQGLKTPMSANHIHTISDGEISTEAQLDALYGAVSERSILKELDHISDHYRAFIERSPFLVLASVGPEGLDASPRGDAPGFCRVVDSKTVLIPDRRGNNRIDSLRNIVRDPRVSLLFLIPGVGETIRINGRARLTTNEALCDSFKVNGKTPRTVIAVTTDRVYFQCQKAFARSRLWSKDAQTERKSLPSTGEMLAAVSDASFDAQAYDDGYSEHMKKTIY